MIADIAMTDKAMAALWSAVHPTMSSGDDLAVA
jgi:hypothetical protein